MSSRCRTICSFLATVLVVAALSVVLRPGSRAEAAAVLPAGFREQVVFSGLNQPVNIEFAGDGRVFVAEKAGVIKVFDDLADTTPTVFADLSRNVHNQHDRGLLGLALHPQFPTQPWVYVLYTYDAPRGVTAPYWNDNCASVGGVNGGQCVVTGRLSRLQASGNAMVGSEQALITDWCEQFSSHSIGDLKFGADGALYVTAGDGASFNVVDYGQLGSPPNPCADPSREGGALRAQDVRTATDPTGLGGALLRVDPGTGAAAAGNPRITSSDLNTRRIVAHGFRNPYRAAVRPGTSELWVGDVGWNDYEEIGRVASPTAGVSNFGWPCLEGAGRQPGYDGANLPLCESLYTSGGYSGPHYTYHHSAKVVSGESCPTGGSAISGLAFHPTSGSTYPATYRGALFFADYARDCIWAMLPTTAGGLPAASNRITFVAGAANPVDLATGPGGELYYADAAGSVRRIRYFAGNQPPVAVLAASPGATVLTVDFDGSSSYDPDPADADLLRYEWDFTNDGTVDARTAKASYAYPDAGPYTARLRVIDSLGADDVQTVTLQPGNTAPVPVVDSPGATLTWKVGDTISFAGHATDAQDGVLPASALTWRLVLQHCYTLDSCHEHTLQDWAGVAGASFRAPDHEYPSYLELVLRATDSGGLSEVTKVRIDPRTVDLTFTSNPPGVQLAVGPTIQATPFTRTVIQGSANSVSAVTPQALAGVPYGFAGWSDSGAQTHLITAPSSAATYSATFVRHRLPQSQVRIRYVDSQETTVVNNAATNVLDGNLGTIWHTRFSTATDPPHPHEIQLDLAASYAVTNLYYRPRQDHPNGRIARYEVYVSNDPNAWGTAVATGTFPNASAEQMVSFPAKTGRYVRLRALSEVNGGPWTSAAELNVGVAPRLPQSSMRVRSVDSQETAVPGVLATSAIDGKPTTFWHTQYVAADPPHPHRIELDLGRTATVSCLFHLARQDGYTNGRTADYEVATSVDGTTWSAAGAGTWGNTASERAVCFPARSTRYVRFRALSEVLGQPWTSVAELAVGGI
jgi:glucose/arabinose dehydrogenase/PKD repeat protein